jgi:hypothetical protein
MWLKRLNRDSSSGLSLKAALDYGRLGWSYIPIEPRGKRPLIPWEIHQHRHADAPQANEWFQRWPDANIAVVTGAISGLVVLDLDPRHGADDSLARLVQMHGPLPETAEVLTGNGGRHLYFAHPGAILHDRGRLAPGIDLHGDGGYVVAPPSVHQSGKRYTWVRPAQYCFPQPLPEWLHAEPAPGSGHGHPVEYWRRLLREEVAADDRNETIASLAGHLLWHGLDPEVTTELLLGWNALRCHPPLDPQEVAHTVASIARLHQRKPEQNA